MSLRADKSQFDATGFREEGDRLRPGEISPDTIEWVAKELHGAAQLCTALAGLGDDSVIGPDAVEAIGDLIRAAVKKLRDELAAAEARK
jgi:hypothetical protein